jgi:HEPN domain-containing protein
MEHEGIADEAVRSAKRWLVSAELNAGKGNYDSALYSLEMSVEIAMKAVLLSIGIDVPKSHRIGDVFTASVRDEKRLPEEFKRHVEECVDIFNALLELRAAGGYMFESKTTMDELRTEYERYRKDAENVVGLCAVAVHAATSGS